MLSLLFVDRHSTQLLQHTTVLLTRGTPVSEGFPNFGYVSVSEGFPSFGYVSVSEGFPTLGMSLYLKGSFTLGVCVF